MPVRLLVALLTALPAILSPTCGPGGPSAGLSLAPSTTNPSVGSFFDVDLVVSVGATGLQAFEVALEIDPPIAAPWIAFEHAEFDDDGGLFLTPDLDLVGGTAERIVDLRHGPTAVTGTRRVATVRFLAFQAGAATLRFTGSVLSTSAGEAFTTLSLPAQIVIGP